MGKYKVFARIQTYIKSHYEKLNIEDFILGDAPFNYRCHLNSVQKVKEGKAEKVYSCFAINKDDNSQCVHFINQLSDGKYQDNTWGWTYSHYEYYLIKEINKDEQEYIWEELSNLKNLLVMNNSNCLERFFYRINKNFV